MLITKDGFRSNSAKVSDIDFETMKKDKIEDRKSAWNKYYAENQGKEENDFLRSVIYGIPKEVKTLDQYLQLPAIPLTTYAAITPDGNWHAPGEMGWWGVSSETDDQKKVFQEMYHEKLITPAIENGWDITIVDCHI